MRSRKEQAEIFYDEVMGGDNALAQKILRRVAAACINILGKYPVSVPLSREESRWLFTNNQEGVLDDYVKAITDERRMLIEWHRVTKPCLHIEDPESLCDECKEIMRKR